MRNILKYPIIMIGVMTFFSGAAQQDFELALYNYHQGVYNPAAVGTQEGSFLNTSFRSQWFGIKDAPRIQAITLGFPTGEKRTAFGLTVTNDKTFIEGQTRFYGTFSYRLPLNDDWDLHLGLSAGGNNLTWDFNELDNLLEVGDGSFENYSHFNPNVGIGAYLKKENAYFSLSIPQLLATQRNREEQGISTSARDRVHIYALGGIRVPLKGDWSWVNSALFRYVSDAPVSTIINTGMAYKKMEATVGYQINAGITGTFMIQEFDNKGMALGYSYQMPSVGQLSSLTGGNHEILLRIRLGKDPAKKEEEKPDESTIGTRNLENSLSLLEKQ